MTVIGLLHPGQMGASIGAAAVLAGNDVLWCSEGRSDATIARADAAGLTDLGTVASVAEHAEMILSVCPPDRAVALATLVADSGFSGIYVDANAVAPSTAGAVKQAMTGSGTNVVDAAIIGPPAWIKGSTRMYVAGDGARLLAPVFTGSPLDVVVLDSAYGSASALKMAYAGWTKGAAALTMTVVAYATSAGVEEVLFDEWGLSQPEMVTRARGVARSTSPKAWRFVGEMNEIAASLKRAGLPSGFHESAAEIYERLGSLKDEIGDIELGEVVELLLDVGPSRCEE